MRVKYSSSPNSSIGRNVRAVSTAIVAIAAILTGGVAHPARLERALDERPVRGHVGRCAAPAVARDVLVVA